MLTLALKEDNRTTAEITFREDRLGRLGRLRASVIDITSRLSPERGRVEDFIRRTYTDAYDARIAVDYPVLMSVRDAQGTLFAAAGFRLACEGRLFLEQYTRAPIEDALAAAYGACVPRAAVAEVGNLASGGQGGAVFLYAALASHLDHRGVTHVAATCTPALRRQFTRLGFALEDICAASPGAVAGADAWGRYYETAPRVVAGLIRESRERLEARLGTVYHARRPPYFARLHPKELP